MKPNHALPRTLFFVLFLIGTILAGTVPGQTAGPTVRGQITGRVVGADDTPIPGVTVSARALDSRDGLPTAAATAVSDATGAFTLPELLPRLYSLDISAPGFASPERPRPARIGETVTIRLTRGGVITGHVTDRDNRPLVEVVVYTRLVADAEGRPVPVERPASYSTTDDRGEYRRWGLTPGRYLVWVEGGGGRLPTPIDGDAPTYYPTTTRVGAREVSVTEGGETSGIDIRHRGQTGVAVAGKVFGVLPETIVRLKLQDPTTQAVVFETLLFNRPEFTFTGIPAGEYDLVASSILKKGDRAYSDPVRVVVKTKDIEGLAVTLIPTGAVEGKFEVTSPDQERLDRCKLEATSPMSETVLDLLPKKVVRAPGELPPTVPNDNAAFRVPGVKPGDYALAVTPPAAWYVASLTEPATPNPKPLGLISLKKGASLDGVAVTLEFGAAQLRGTVAALPKSPEAVQKLRVHLIPMDEAQIENTARFYETTVAAGGGFEFKNLAPGRYAVVVLKKDVPEGENPAFPVAADPAKRKTLREAAKTGKSIELAPCRAVEDFKIEGTP